MTTKENKIKEKYTYEVRLVKGAMKFIVADRFVHSYNEGVKFYLNGELIFFVAHQKWEYILRQSKITSSN